MQHYLIGGAIALLGIAGWAVLADRRRANRANPDRVGWISWPLVLVLALIGALMFAILAIGGG